MSTGLEREITNRAAYDRNRQHLADAGVVLPRLACLADPVVRLVDKSALIAGSDTDSPDAANLFRVHWHNDESRQGLAAVPEHVVLGPELTGVDAKIIVALGNRFPMIRAHKVLAAYGCLVPRLLSGSFDAGTAPGHVAVDRKLLSRRCRDIAHRGLPRGCCFARRHEPRAFRLA